MASAQKRLVAVTACPRCQKPLIDPSGLGWCKGCGYCHSLEQNKPQIPATPVATPPSSVVSLSGPRVPRWCWLLGAECILLGVATFFINRQFPNLTPFHRALWCTLQLAVGLGFLFCAQLSALILIAPEEPTLGFKDLLLPFRLYVLIFKHLSRVRVPLILIFLSLTLMASALGFVGGLGYWYQFMPGQRDGVYKPQFN